MSQEHIIEMISDHLDRGGKVRLYLDGGVRFAKLQKWRYFGPTFKINGATEVVAQRLIAARQNLERHNRARSNSVVTSRSRHT